MIATSFSVKPKPSSKENEREEEMEREEREKRKIRDREIMADSLRCVALTQQVSNISYCFVRVLQLTSQSIL